MEHISDHEPDRQEAADQEAEVAAPLDRDSAALWQELDGYHGLQPDNDARATDALASRPGGESVSDRVAQSVAMSVVMPVFAQMRDHGRQLSTEADAAASGDRTKDLNADQDGDGPTVPPDGKREAADDDGGLPKRERGDERTLSDEARERLIEINRA